MPEMKTNTLLFITLRAVVLILAAFGIALLVLDDLLPILGFNISSKMRGVVMLIVIWGTFALTAGPVMTKLKRSKVMKK